MKRSKTFFLLFSVLLILSRASISQTPSSSQSEGTADVVVIAFHSLEDSQETHRAHIREMITGDDDAVSDLNDELLKIQIAIIKVTAPFGPVAGLVPDGQTKAVLSDRCRDWEICELLNSGRLRLQIVPHEGVWIRDFGPQIESSLGTPRVVHWRYFDNREHDSLEQQREEINRLRLSLLEIKLKQRTSDSLLSSSDDEMEGDTTKEAASAKALDDKIAA